MHRSLLLCALAVGLVAQVNAGRVLQNQELNTTASATANATAALMNSTAMCKEGGCCFYSAIDKRCVCLRASPCLLHAEADSATTVTPQEALDAAYNASTSELDPAASRARG
jgi:hypothetical protein